MIAIIDYGVGNLTSVKKAFDRVSGSAVVTRDPDAVAQAEKIVLSGVGHFAATQALSDSGMRQVIEEAVHRGVPLLGICVGMQWLLHSSDEAPEIPGLGLFPGKCSQFVNDVKSPHVGWNQLDVSFDSRLLRDIPTNSYAYFTHSYKVPVNGATVAQTDYGGRFSAAVERDNIFGVQFHPEKSADTGLKVLRTFCSL